MSEPLVAQVPPSRHVSLPISFPSSLRSAGKPPRAGGPWERAGYSTAEQTVRHRAQRTTRIDDEAGAIVDTFDDAPDDSYVVTEQDALMELRAAAAARRDAESRIEAAALRAHRDGASWGIIGTQLGMTRQGARQRFERLTDS